MRNWGLNFLPKIGSSCWAPEGVDPLSLSPPFSISLYMLLLYINIFLTGLLYSDYLIFKSRRPCSAPSSTFHSSASSNFHNFRTRSHLHKTWPNNLRHLRLGSLPSDCIGSSVSCDKDKVRSARLLGNS